VIARAFLLAGAGHLTIPRYLAGAR